MNIYQDFKSKMDKYNIAKFWIENIAKKDNKSTNHLDKKCSEWKEYVALIELILSQLDEDQKDIIDRVYISKTGKEKINYSVSTFYIKQKRAVQRFLEIYNFADSL